MKHLYQVTFLILCNIKLPFNLVIATFTETNQAPPYTITLTLLHCVLFTVSAVEDCSLNCLNCHVEEYYVELLKQGSLCCVLLL